MTFPVVFLKILPSLVLESFLVCTLFSQTGLFTIPEPQVFHPPCKHQPGLPIRVPLGQPLPSTAKGCIPLCLLTPKHALPGLTVLSSHPLRDSFPPTQKSASSLPLGPSQTPLTSLSSLFYYGFSFQLELLLPSSPQSGLLERVFTPFYPCPHLPLTPQSKQCHPTEAFCQGHQQYGYL